VNLDELIRECNEKIDQKAQEIAAYLQQVKQFDVQIHQIKTDINNTKRQAYALQDQINAINSELSELRAYQEEEVTIDLSNIENEIVEIETEKNHYQSDLEKVILQINVLEEKIKPIKEQITLKKKEGDRIADEYNVGHGEVEVILAQVANIVGEIMMLEQQKQQTVTKKNEQEAIKAKLEKELAEYITAARTINPERIYPHNKETSSVMLGNEIEDLTQRLRNEENRRGDPIEITNRYKDAKKKFIDTKDNIGKLNTFVQRMEINLNERQKRWHNYRKSIGMRTTLLFNMFLTNKNYTGKLNFSHKEQKLDIIVQLDRQTTHDSQRIVKDTRTLSGGERSYSTVAFLLALWETMENPFRAMDEFDVFMDAVNRKIAIDTILEASKNQKHRQFIYITPHDTNAIRSSRDVKVHKMRDPRTGPGQTLIDDHLVS